MVDCLKKSCPEGALVWQKTTLTTQNGHNYRHGFCTHQDRLTTSPLQRGGCLNPKGLFSGTPIPISLVLLGRSRYAYLHVLIKTSTLSWLESDGPKSNTLYTFMANLRKQSAFRIPSEMELETRRVFMARQGGCYVFSFPKNILGQNWTHCFLPPLKYIQRNLNGPAVLSVLWFPAILSCLSMRKDNKDPTAAPFVKVPAEKIFCTDHGNRWSAVPGCRNGHSHGPTKPQG